LLKKEADREKKKEKINLLKEKYAEYDKGFIGVDDLKSYIKDVRKFFIIY
jgi:hypothetical protein